MLFAAIDIGTNAVRLLFANVFETAGQIHVEKATLTRIPVRLGKDVFNKQKISPKRADDLIKTVLAYKLLIDVYRPVAYEACATSAMREASNGPDLIKKIKRETGIKVRVIDGLEEAAILRAIELPGHGADNKFMIYIDVGGGSTEISVMQNNQLLDAGSFKLGTLRILEKKAKSSEWKSMDQWLKPYHQHPNGLICIGTGGNINKINKLFGDQQSEILGKDRLGYAYEYLKGYTVNERVDILGLRLDRADVIVPAAQIYLTVLEAVGAESIHVPKLGLVDGMVYNLYKKYRDGFV